jgi:hypothetical protein
VSNRHCHRRDCVSDFPGVAKPNATFSRHTGGDGIRALQANITSQLVPLHATADLLFGTMRPVITIPDRTFIEPLSGAFAAPHSLEDAFSLAPIESEIIHAVMTIDQLFAIALGKAADALRQVGVPIT